MVANSQHGSILNGFIRWALWWVNYPFSVGLWVWRPNYARLPRGMATGLLIKVLILMYQTTVQVDDGRPTGDVLQQDGRTNNRIMKRPLHGTLRFRNSPTGEQIQNGRRRVKLQEIQLPLACAENFVIFFYDIKLFFTYLLTYYLLLTSKGFQSICWAKEFLLC